MDELKSQNEITFILPTMNRKGYIVRAIESCLSCSSSILKPYVLVIDGMSDDGSYELLLNTYSNHNQVKIVRHERVGFQRTAYFGAKQVKTEYVTYMYDDDLISPHFSDFFAKMLEEKKEFIMGYGKIYNIDDRYPFQKLSRFRLYEKYDAALAYFGYFSRINFYNLPVSPICTIVKTNFLKSWVKFTQDFAQKSKIRFYYMIDRNIGPDIIIYLASILREEKSALICEQIVGQFSEHLDSMSIGYGESHLEAGYWFGKLWAFEEIVRQGKIDVAARCGAYLVIQGYKILLKMLTGQDRKWFWQFFAEVMHVKKVAIKHSMFLILCASFATTFKNKAQTKKFIPSPQ